MTSTNEEPGYFDFRVSRTVRRRKCKEASKKEKIPDSARFSRGSCSSLFFLARSIRTTTTSSEHCWCSPFDDGRRSSLALAKSGFGYHHTEPASLVREDAIKRPASRDRSRTFLLCGFRIDNRRRQQQQQQQFRGRSRGTFPFQSIYNLRSIPLFRNKASYCSGKERTTTMSSTMTSTTTTKTGAAAPTSALICLAILLLGSGNAVVVVRAQESTSSSGSVTPGCAPVPEYMEGFCPTAM